MKATGARWNKDAETFCVDFDDNITLILDRDLQYRNMLSVGLSSYFLDKGKWPTGKNLEKRITLASEWVNKNKHRYKDLK